MLLQVKRFLLTVLLLGASSLSAVWQAPPTELTTGGQLITVASDANGHAFAIYNGNIDADVLASYYTAGAWGAPVTIGTGPVDVLAAAMDDSGTALAIWYNIFTGQIHTASFNGSSWTIPSPDPLDTITSLITPSLAIAMNGPNQGVAIWIDTTTNNVSTSFFSSGNWSTPTVIGTGVGNASIDYSTNGTAVAGWSDGDTSVANFVGNVWQPSVQLDPTGQAAVVGIDASGNALAVWIDASNNVASSRFIGGSWEPTVVIATPGNAFDPLLGVAPGGTAVAIWSTFTGVGQSSSFDGTSWSAAIQYTAGPLFTSADNLNSLSVNNSGDALAVFFLTDGNIRSTRLPLGATAWNPGELVSTYVDNPTSITASLSANGIGFATWSIDDGDGNVTLFADATLAPTPPSNLQGQACKERFAMQTEYINILTWSPSTAPGVVSYDLRRDGILIATIPAVGPYIYIDHNRCKNVVYTYSLTAVDIDGVESTPVTVTIL